MIKSLNSWLKRRPQGRQFVRAAEALEVRALLAAHALDVPSDGDANRHSAYGLTDSGAALTADNVTGKGVIDLPGMSLVESSVDPLADQLIYLDFDGAQSVSYNGPVTVGPFDVLAFRAPGAWTGQEASIIEAVRERLEAMFGCAGLNFTTDLPTETGDFSTVFIGGDGSAFDDYGSFLGLAEQVDSGNRSVIDRAFVFSERIGNSESVGDYVAGLTDAIGHEVGHLLGYAHTGAHTDGGNALEHVAYAVTFVTHGFNSNADFWVDAMADAVIARVAADTPFQESDVAKYELTVNGTGATLTQQSAQSYLTAASGETVIRLDWSALAGTLFNMQGDISTDEVAPTIADYIFASQPWIVEGALHLIGHSRGASLITALAAELADHGVWVDQTTFLDPHPRTTSEASDPDYPMNIPENVVFADGYWREGSGVFNPDGEHVPGAFNIQLNEDHFAGGTVGYGGFLAVDTHADVHLWYHGTIDNVGGFSDVVNGSGETVAAADAGYWYAPDAYDAVAGNLPSGRNDVGYAFSHVVGNARPGIGVAQALGGQGPRSNIDWSTADWPNLLAFTVDAADFHFDIGESIPVRYYFQDADSNAAAEFYLDIDRNPHNGNATMVGPSFVLLGGSTVPVLDSRNLTTVGLTAGSYYVSARTTDTAGRTRWAYAPLAVTLEVPLILPTITSVDAGDANRSGIRELTLTFDQPVTVGAAGALSLFNHTTGQSVSLSGATLVGNGTTSVTWVLADGPGGMADIVLADGRYTAELAANATTPGLAASLAFEFHKLAGDVDGDALVNFNDYFAVRSQFNASGAAYRPGDADGDGLVNFNDYFAVRANFNAGLAAMTYDFGDAPTAAQSTFAASYPTTLADNGARHVITNNTLFLGTLPDAETNGAPTADALGDDNAGSDDEDGITLGNLEIGTTVGLTVTATVPASAVLNAWIDFNRDGDWLDPGEHVFLDEPIANGA
ncbi:MAG: hypothetical protein AB7U20_01950, partial [Planctomycetaceae bacterium]